VRFVVVQVLDRIFNPGISLDSWNFEFFWQLDCHDTFSEWGRSIQETVYSINFSLALLLDFKLQLIILFFILLIERGDGFVEPSFLIMVIHHPFTRRRIHGSFNSPRSVFRSSSFREPSTLPVFFLVGVAFSFFMSSRYFRNSFIRQPLLQMDVLLS
jgi:hypothetical protein